MNEELLPCPFCGAGNTEIRDNGKVWTGMGYSAPTSTSVFHHCTPITGQPSRAIERVGRDRASAIAAWNQRAISAPQAPAAPSIEAELMQALRDLVNALRERHYGRMPEEVQAAYDKAWAIVFAAPAAAPAAPDDVLCYIRAAATLPERHGFEVCRATDAGAMAVMGDGRAHAMPTVTPAEFAADIDQLLAEPAAPAVDESFEDLISDWAHGDALDAARYRWLRDNATRSGVNIDIGAGVEISATLDAAVDDAMRLTAAKESP